VSREPLFWMFTLKDNGELIAARSGRLAAVNRENIREIVEAFTAVCEQGIECRSPAVRGYFVHVIKAALNREPLIQRERRKLIPLSACGRKAYLRWAVMPVLEAARECVAQWRPAWSVTVSASNFENSHKCALEVNTQRGTDLLTFSRETLPSGETVLCYQVASMGSLSPAEPFETVMRETATVIDALASPKIVGEFLYGLVSLAAEGDPAFF
jgi:hypothetical protein